MHRVGRIYNNIPHVLPSLAKEINRVSLIWGIVHNVSIDELFTQECSSICFLGIY
jgi:hypothetical protein